MMLFKMLLLLGFAMFSLVGFVTTLFMFLFRASNGPSFKVFVSPANIQNVPLPYLVLIGYKLLRCGPELLFFSYCLALHKQNICFEYLL